MLGYVMIDEGPDYPYGAYISMPNLPAPNARLLGTGLGADEDVLSDELKQALRNAMYGCAAHDTSHADIVNPLVDILRAFSSPADRAAIRQYLTTYGTADAKCLACVTEAFTAIAKEESEPAKRSSADGFPFSYLVGGAVGAAAGVGLTLLAFWIKNR